MMERLYCYDCGHELPADIIAGLLQRYPDHVCPICSVSRLDEFLRLDPEPDHVVIEANV